jgi:hypothetical protein
MASLPVEILLGIYLGLLVGVIPALVSWALGFSFKYITGVTIPGFGVVVLAIALAGVSGGLLALADRSITQAPNAERIITAIILVGMVSMYAHSKGDQMGATIPKRISLRGLRERRLSSDVVNFVSGRGEVSIRVTGEVADMEGYAPLSEPLRSEIRGSEWTFPAELRITELEERLEERLRTEFDLSDVSAAVDEQGCATIVAAPPFSGLSKRVGDGRRAVSIDAVLPTGLARNDEVTVLTPDTEVRGIVISARTESKQEADEMPEEPAVADVDTPSHSVKAPTTDGGDGRLTVSVRRTDADPLLKRDTAKVVVEPRGTRREYELISLLRRAGKRFRRLTITAGTSLDGVTIRDIHSRENHDVAIIAVRKPGGWQLTPDGDTVLAAGEELYAIGSPSALDAFEGVVA